jgi:regulator of sirC expression with transglutaminase-like and TPR domain
VLFAAERAIKSDPENINYRDTRGLIRALTGDVSGAIEDFKVFVAGAKNYPPKMVEQRHLWLAALALEKNPFTDDVLAQLRAE